MVIEDHAAFGSPKTNIVRSSGRDGGGHFFGGLTRFVAQPADDPSRKQRRVGCFESRVLTDEFGPLVWFCAAYAVSPGNHGGTGPRVKACQARVLTCAEQQIIDGRGGCHVDG